MTRPAEDSAPEPQHELDQPPDRFDTVTEALLLLLLVFAPLAFGAVEAWSELVVIVLSSALVLCLGAKYVWRQDARPVLSWSYFPFGLFLFLAAFQLAPLHASLLSVLSSESVSVRQTLLADLPQGLPQTFTTSFYPEGTRHDLRIALALAAIFVAAAHIYRRPAALKRLLGTVAALGAGIALLAIAQKATSANRIYWLVPIRTNDADGGTFVNRNNFCLFVNLSIGAAFALLLWRLHDGMKGIKKDISQILDWITSPASRGMWLMVGVIVICMTGVFLSLSRGGTISLLFAASLITVSMAWRRHLDGREWIILAVILAAFVCVLFLGFDAVFDRLATLEEKEAYRGRWQILQGVALAWTRFPLMGTGLGTHEVVYPMFDRTTSPSLKAFAENEYAQTAEETGLIGPLLVATFAFLMWKSWRRLHSRGWHAAVAYGLGFALVAALAHSIGDFGLHLPANGALVATWCGVIVGLAQTARSAGSDWATSPVSRRLIPSAAVLAIAALIFGWSTTTAYHSWIAERDWNEACRIEAWLREHDWEADTDLYASLISHAAAAAESAPGRVDYRHWLSIYRWRSISQYRDPETGKILLSPLGIDYVRHIVQDLHEAREECPTFGPLYCVAGQLERWGLNDPAGSEHILRGYTLTPHDPTACLVAGLLDANEGRPDDAFLKLDRALSLDSSLFRVISDALVSQHQAELAEKLAADDPEYLAVLEARLKDLPEFAAAADRVRKKAVEVLAERCQSEDAPASLLASAARLCLRRNEPQAAERYFRRALEADYGQTGWRLELARIYASQGRTEDAVREARICLRLTPQMTAARRLIESAGQTRDL